MTPAWKASVRTALKNNKLANRSPSDQRQLADAIGVHKTAITKMFAARSSALVEPICRVLGLPLPMRGTDPDDELHQAIDRLDAKGQAELLRFAQFLLSKLAAVIACHALRHALCWIIVPA